MTLAFPDLHQVAHAREQGLFGLVILVAVVLFFRVFLAGQSAQLAAVKTRYQNLEFEKKALVNFAKSTPTLRKTERLSRPGGIKMKVVYGEIKGRGTDLGSLLAELTDPAFLEGVSLQKMSFQPVVMESGYRRTDFTLEVAGDFTNIIHYLENLEKFPALFDLKNIHLKSSPGNPQDVQAVLETRFFQMDEINENVSQTGGRP